MAYKQKGVWDIDIVINGEKVKNNLNGIGKEIGKLNSDLKKLTPGTEEFIRKSAELKKAREKYAEIKTEINGTNDALAEARGNWDSLVQGFLSGNVQQIQAGLKGIVGNIKGITKAALAFIATPFGAALAIVTAVGLGVKKWVEYNLEIEKTNQLVRDLTQESGVAIDIIRIRAEELANTFEVDVKESIESAKSLVNGFGISYSEAFDIIEEGAIRGKLKNGEFLDSLKEYPVQFKNAGFSAQDFANIVSTGIDLSIYSDKLPDAIKEFALSVTEQTPAAKEALTNAFGPEFTGKLMQGLKNGSITAKEALAQISAEAENIGLNSQQAQLLTADLFKGAGEDAGGALKIFEAVNLALNEQKKPLTDIQQLQKEQLDANKELNSVYTQLFASGSKGFNMWIAKGKLFATQTLLKILKGGVDVYNWIIDLNNESRVFSGLLTLAGKSATASFKIFGSLLSGIKDQVVAAGKIFEGMLTLDPSKIKEGLHEGFNNVKRGLSNIKTAAVEEANEIYNAFSGKDKLEKFSLEDFLSTDPTSTNNSTNNSNSIITENGLTPEDKSVLDSKKKLAELLDEWEKERAIQKEIEEFDELEKKKELDLIRLEEKFAKLEEEAAGEKELLTRLEAEKKAALSDIETNYLEEKAKRQEEYQKKYEEKLKQHNERLIAAEMALQNATRNALQFGLNTLTSFGQEKSEIYHALFALEKGLAIGGIITNSSQAIAQIVANTAIANTKAVAASPLTGGMPWVGINTATAAKQTLATKINAGVQIASIGANAIKGFYDGGFTGSNGIYRDQFDEVAGVAHVGEWYAPKFMVENPKYAPTINWLENERKRGLGHYFNGGHATNSNSPSVNDSVDSSPISNNSNNELAAEIKRLNDNLEKGIYSYNVKDYEEYLRRRETDQEFEQILNNTRS